MLKATPSSVPWALEPTGRYSQGVAQQGRQSRRDIRLAPPKKAPLFLKSVQSRAKTDTLDSYGLALYGLSCPLAPYLLKSEMQDELDQLLLARKGLSQSVCKLQARQHELPRASAALVPAVGALQNQLKQLDNQIALLTKAPELKAIQELQKVPGFGPVVATTLVSRLTARSFKAQYERERLKGLSSTAALCAVARKMAKLVWSIITEATYLTTIIEALGGGRRNWSSLVSPTWMLQGNELLPTLIISSSVALDFLPP